MSSTERVVPFQSIRLIARRRPSREPPYSALRHRYNYGLMYKGDYQPEIFTPVYSAKQIMEDTDSMVFIRSAMTNFVPYTRNITPIDELIGINSFKSHLLANTFFIIDYDLLMRKFKLYTGCTPEKALKINDLINNILLPSYKSLWCVQYSLEIMTNLLPRIRLTTSKPKSIRSVSTIIIDESLIPEESIDDELLTFNELWADDEVAYNIPETTTITPLMVLKYYIEKLNKLIMKLHHYRITIAITIIEPLNKELKSLNAMLKSIYYYDPQWKINVEETRARSLEKSKKKRSSKNRSKRRARSL